MTVNGVDLLMDVYIPAGEGPWPVVVAFHGVDSRGKDSQDNIPIAEGAAAERHRRSDGTLNHRDG